MAIKIPALLAQRLTMIDWLMVFLKLQTLIAGEGYMAAFNG
jgi:hypothetical protein